MAAMHDTHQAQASANLPSSNELSEFLQTYLPIKEKDVDWYYHKPGPPKFFDLENYNYFSGPVHHFVLGVIPSNQFYHELDTAAKGRPRFRLWKPDPQAERPPPTGAKGIIGFLHRPFDLDHRRVARGPIVHASHKSLDELLTTGWNVQLANCLGLRAQSSSPNATDGPIVIQGYKGDPDRRIGLIGRLNQPTSLSSFVHNVRGEFDGAGDLYLGEQMAIPSDEGKPRIVSAPSKAIPDRQVEIVALMNAFNVNEVERIIDLCIQNKLITGSQGADRIVCVSGAPREIGLQMARMFDMPVICVGHRPCEEWGIKFLARKVRQRWPSMHVVEALDDDEQEAEINSNMTAPLPAAQ